MYWLREYIEITKGTNMKNELWQAIAAGLLNSWQAELVSITNQDSRNVLQIKNVWPSWLLEKSWSATGNVISDTTLGQLYDEIPDKIYNPVIRDQINLGKPPFVTNATVTNGNTLTCDNQDTLYTTYVFSWDSGQREFTELGTLSENSQPGSGYYVLVNTFSDNPGESFSLPSLFLQLTS